MKSLCLFILCALAAHAYADEFAKTAVSGPETWKRYVVRGFELGTPRSVLAKKGFNCGKRANSRCFKVVDDRCKKGRCEFKEDAFGQWFELNGAKTDLDYITIATTETDGALAYDIRYAFGPRQLLAEDSTLGKALIAKYGSPTKVEEPGSDDKVGGGRMLWWNDDVGNNGPNIIVDCSNYGEKICMLEAEDYGIQSVEHSKQEERDDKKKRAAQPAKAPDL
jgi:hypothetical protein